jgi:cytochrome c
LLGTVAGERSNFPYSKAMKSSGITWTDKHLFLYLANPGKHIPGNKMSFAGLTGDQDRANLISYLRAN